LQAYNSIFASLGVAFAVVCLGLVSAWANYNPKIQLEWGAAPLYLGIPNWTTHPFSWHVVLMVCGYFLSQVMSLSSIVLFGSKTTVALSHMFWQIAALCTLIAGMRAVVKWKYDNWEDSLNTLHSWVGVLAIVMFFFSFLFSMGVGAGAVVMKSNLSSGTTWVHMCLSIITLGLTFMCIITGIEAHNGFDGCAFLKANPDHTALNSAFYYGKDYPWSCKLSNGMGICAMFATFFTVAGLMASSSVALFESKDETEAANDDQGIELGEAEEAK
jgi:protein-S-isoprenylcysteine O-methyltransferase Ste14